MCKTCKGTGGLNIEHSWGIEYKPCPDTNCDFDHEKAKEEIRKYCEYRIAKIMSESA